MRVRYWLYVLVIAIGAACASAPADVAAQRAAQQPTPAQQTPARPPQTGPTPTQNPPPPSTVAPSDPGTTTVTQGPVLPPTVTPPAEKGSVLFAVIGDTGTGTQSQFDIGKQLVTARTTFPFEFVIMVGDNIYGSERPQDFSQKFEKPYQALLDAKVQFYAALGNHDDPTQRFYKPFNMNGERFYTYTKGNARFFVLDSNYMDAKQLKWLEDELSKSNDHWKIAYFHHPLYSSGGRHGSEVDLRTQVEPLFVKYGMDVVFAGHEHFYERVKPQKGIYYFTEGGSAKLAKGDIKKSALTAAGVDNDFTFMLTELDKDAMRFQVISRGGKPVDAGTLPLAPEPKRPADDKTRSSQ
jgi:predicted phosphodiesterase